MENFRRFWSETVRRVTRWFKRGGHFSVKLYRRVEANPRIAIAAAASLIIAGSIFYGGMMFGQSVNAPVATTNLRTPQTAQNPNRLATSPATTNNHWVYRGKVTNINGQTLTIKTAEGLSQTIATNPTTHLALAGKATSLKDLKVGNQIVVSGSTDQNGVLVAAVLHLTTPVKTKP